MLIQTDGLVIKENSVGESDRLVTLLTRERGVIRAFVRGAKSVKNKALSATQLFSYGEFTIWCGKDKYIINEAEPKEVFFALRSDIEKLSLAQYFAQLSLELAPQEDEAESFLRLALNSLHLLAGGKKPMLQLKAIFELRAMTISGYMPNLLACETCGVFETQSMYFDFASGSLFCANCRTKGVKLDSGVVTAMRYIIYSEFGALFGFTLSTEGIKNLSRISERYVLTQIGHGYKTLDFFKTVYTEEQPNEQT